MKMNKKCDYICNCGCNKIVNDIMNKDIKFQERIDLFLEENDIVNEVENMEELYKLSYIISKSKKLNPNNKNANNKNDTIDFFMHKFIFFQNELNTIEKEIVKKATIKLFKKERSIDVNLLNEYFIDFLSSDFSSRIKTFIENIIFTIEITIIINTKINNIIKDYIDKNIKRLKEMNDNNNVDNNNVDDDIFNDNKINIKNSTDEINRIIKKIYNGNIKSLSLFILTTIFDFYLFGGI
jgi:hypothetical protein